ncbi:MAG: Lrp/AsnC family transcriptional regulator [Actinomycetota bacterium]
MAYEIDDLDRKVLTALRRGDRPSVTDIARMTGLARGTVQTRLARLLDTGVITGWGPELGAGAVGHPVTSFTVLSIAQGALDVVIAGIREIPEVLEVHVTTGRGDLLCKIVARNNDHLHQLIQRIVALDGVVRTDSQLALAEPIHRTLADLVAAR